MAGWDILWQRLLEFVSAKLANMVALADKAKLSYPTLGKAKRNKQTRSRSKSRTEAKLASTPAKQAQRSKEAKQCQVEASQAKWTFKFRGCSDITVPLLGVILRRFSEQCRDVVPFRLEARNVAYSDGGSWNPFEARCLTNILLASPKQKL